MELKPREADFLVGRFDLVRCLSESVQARVARYVMLWKPVGVMCATRDAEHETVVDLFGDFDEWQPFFRKCGFARKKSGQTLCGRGRWRDQRRNNHRF